MLVEVVKTSYFHLRAPCFPAFHHLVLWGQHQISNSRFTSNPFLVSSYYFFPQFGGSDSQTLPTCKAECFFLILVKLCSLSFLALFLILDLQLSGKNEEISNIPEVWNNWLRGWWIWFSCCGLLAGDFSNFFFPLSFLMLERTFNMLNPSQQRLVEFSHEHCVPTSSVCNYYSHPPSLT